MGMADRNPRESCQDLAATYAYDCRKRLCTRLLSMNRAAT